MPRLAQESFSPFPRADSLVEQGNSTPGMDIALNVLHAYSSVGALKHLSSESYKEGKSFPTLGQMAARVMNKGVNGDVRTGSSMITTERLESGEFFAAFSRKTGKELDVRKVARVLDAFLAIPGLDQAMLGAADILPDDKIGTAIRKAISFAQNAFYEADFYISDAIRGIQDPSDTYKSSRVPVDREKLLQVADTLEITLSKEERAYVRARLESHPSEEHWYGTSEEGEIQQPEMTDEEADASEEGQLQRLLKLDSYMRVLSERFVPHVIDTMTPTAFFNAIEDVYQMREAGSYPEFFDPREFRYALGQVKTYIPRGTRALLASGVPVVFDVSSGQEAIPNNPYAITLQVLDESTDMVDLIAHLNMDAVEKLAQEGKPHAILINNKPDTVSILYPGENSIDIPLTDFRR